MNENFRLSIHSLARGLARCLLAIMLTATILGLPSTIARADTPVCGTIAVHTTWNQVGSPYIVTCDVVVNAGVYLTIEPDVVVKFDPDLSLVINGNLIAQGVIFTSNQEAPDLGDWRQIRFSATSDDATFDQDGNYVGGSIIEDSIIEWGGSSPLSIEGVLEINSTSPYIHHNSIQYNSARGIYALARSAGVLISITENMVTGNGFLGGEGGGIYVVSGNLISNTVSNNIGWPQIGIEASNSTVRGNTVSGNPRGGIYASGSTVEWNLVSGNSDCGIVMSNNSAVNHNTVINNSGNGICANGGTISNNTIAGNAATNDGGGIQAVNATVANNIVTNNSAPNCGGIYARSANIVDNAIEYNSASIAGGGMCAIQGVTASRNSVRFNDAGKGGGIHAYNFSGYPDPSNPILTDNTVEGNSANIGGGIYAEVSIIRGNTIISNTSLSDAGGIFADIGDLADNYIASNSIPSFGHGSGAYLKNVTSFSNNTVISNTASGGTAGGISLEGVSEFHLNNLYANQPYDAEVVSANPISGTLNYWGETLCIDIPTKIYDGNDLPGRGELAYAPSLYAPLPLAQLASPTDLGFTTVTTGTVELAWTAIADIPLVGCRVPGSTEPDSGYLVYYDVDDGCSPFEGTGLPQGDSPIDVGQATEVTLSGLAGNTFFIITTHDYLGRESSYSNVVQSGTEGLSHQLFLPSISNSTDR